MWLNIETALLLGYIGEVEGFHWEDFNMARYLNFA
jgi:hypothetical protein